ncbi:AraC family transcriptional regulator [Burkholderia sp. Ac-20384]|uniref:AraC family transcriptional regulator n=1 Tax=Burkholderia sp. Ac-20384 TaxID=2703902 RepID=UPI00197D3652|nr:AraC family transcriptional regulator [Burkholderia sp. Ac-20384]MBN3822817.1 AraC family transcriptional regulator [Burkholderia sp. Ac-20384]
MSETDFFLQPQYAIQIADQLVRMGGRPPDWFVQLQHPGPNGELTIGEFSFDAFKRLVGDALDATGEPAFGLLVGERLRVGSHGVLGYAVANSVTARQALELIERFVQVRTSLISAKLEIVGEHARLAFVERHPLGDIRQSVMEAIVLTIKNLLDYITRGTSRTSYVAFPFDVPGYAVLAGELFGCEVRYGVDWAGMAFPVAELDRPLGTSNPHALTEAVRICQDELANKNRQQAFSSRIRRLMFEKVGDFPTQRTTAQLLNVTPRTMHRRLADEGTSYREILESVRHKLAIESVKSGKLSLQEIAFLLGYDSLGNFRRAFRRWEGMSPSEYRQSM